MFVDAKYITSHFINILNVKKMNEESAKIAELRQRQKQAIAVLDFAYAKQIDEEIINIKAGNAKLNKQHLYQPTLDQLTSYLEKFDNIVEEKRLMFFKEEKFVRSKYDTKFTQTKSLHMKILSEIQMKQVKAILKERSRPVPEYEDMIVNAQKAAAVGKYELAEQIRDKSSEVAALIFEQREQRINDKYEAIQNNALETMSREIQNLVSLLQRNLASIHTKKADCFDDLYKTREQQIINIHQKFTFLWTKQTPVAKKCAPIDCFNKQFEAILNEFDCPIPEQLLVGEKRIGPQLTPQSLKSSEIKGMAQVLKRSPSPMRNRSPSNVGRSPSTPKSVSSVKSRSPSATPRSNQISTPRRSPSTPRRDF
ncbi:hypothetical protein TRFO_21457 [Tritrichomonas foetus]|uniref:Uncharacterized protein n=1 Tax=Tritrichomonas foetus TaxID=1144522 RepID=A0A1J4KEX2_9EUKA|nr:hypothetical protein TRFO_21457 [Tritrichomonas foetus]|eukprot:OHT09578.1 hypothetical protein TRFO_21457 [Tritrichomonas foetus]